MAAGADRAGRVAQLATAFAALDEQLAGARAVPEKARVVADARQRALGGGWRCCLGLVGGGIGLLDRVGRAELENAEQQLADLFVTPGFFREIRHHQRDKKTGAQRGGFLLADRVQPRGVVQPLALAHIALEGQFGVHRHHRCQALGLHQHQRLVRVFGGRAGRVVVRHRAFHAPHLQHGGRRNDLAVCGVARRVHAHYFAPLAHHRRVDLVPGIDAPVFLAHQGSHPIHPLVFSQGHAPSLVWFSCSRTGAVWRLQEVPALAADRKAGFSPPPCSSTLVPLR